MEESFKFNNPEIENKKKNNIENKNLSRNYSFKRSKKFEIPTKITTFNPFNLKYMPSDKISSLKEINKNGPINKNNNESNTDRNNFEKKIKRTNVNNTINDIYNAINNINKIDEKIKNIFSHSSRKNNFLNIKTECDQTSNNNLLEKNSNINESIARSNSQIIKGPGRNKIIYRNHERNKRDYYTEYNNAYSEENKFKTNSLFRKPKYQASSNRTNCKKYFQYKNYFDIGKENEDDNNLSDFNSISFNLSKKIDNNNIDHKNYTNYGFPFKEKKDYYSEKIMNMKSNLRNIRDQKIRNINKEQKELNYIIDQMQEKNKLVQNRTDINIFKRKHKIKDFSCLGKYKRSESEKYNNINNIDCDVKYNINYNIKYDSDIDEINSDCKNYINHNIKSLFRNNNFYNKFKLNKHYNTKQNNQIIMKKNSYNLNDYIKNKTEVSNKWCNNNNIYLRNSQDLMREIYDYKNSKNILRKKNRYCPFNTDLSFKNTEKILQNIRNKKYNNYIKLKPKISYNKYRNNIEQKYNKLFNKDGSSYLYNCYFD